MGGLQRGKGRKRVSAQGAQGVSAWRRQRKRRQRPPLPLQGSPQARRRTLTGIFNALSVCQRPQHTSIGGFLVPKLAQAAGLVPTRCTSAPRLPGTTAMLPSPSNGERVPEEGAGESGGVAGVPPMFSDMWARQPLSGPPTAVLMGLGRAGELGSAAGRGEEG